MTFYIYAICYRDVIESTPVLVFTTDSEHEVRQFIKEYDSYYMRQRCRLTVIKE